ncbi:hypothetical protein HHI36_003289 [Cryptolaemus montrouzieri]|uniref:ZAD domain-containing protein n=1 Tax=Cryptolaemus montrouzieri TaxID=559131 RepID=A0ABD2PD02_9CUCU
MTGQIKCRLCLDQVYNMKNMLLFPTLSGVDLTIPESISAFFGIKVDKKDIYSKMICANCLSVIELIHMYRKKFRSHQDHLIAIVKTETEDENEKSFAEYQNVNRFL